MDKKILLCGSIIAVVVLVLASLSPVVGFNSVKSSAIDSPLFSVRIKRVINEESEGLTCDYVGKGKESSLLFLRENNSLKMKEIIDIINTLDDEEFKRFQNLIIEYTHRDNGIKNLDITKILLSLTQIRTNERIINIYPLDQKKNLHSHNCWTVPDLMWTCQSNWECFFNWVSIFFLLFISELLWSLCYILTIRVCNLQ